MKRNEMRTYIVAAKKENIIILVLGVHNIYYIILYLLLSDLIFTKVVYLYY